MLLVRGLKLAQQPTEQPFINKFWLVLNLLLMTNMNFFA